MRQSMRASLVGFLLASFVGCTGTVGGGGSGSGGSGTGTGNSTGTGTGNSTGTGTGNSTGTGTGNSTGTGTAGSTGTGGSGPTCVGVCTCTPGIPVTSQIPRMTRVQYDTVLKDLLGITTLASANNQSPSSLLADDSSGPLTDIAWNGYLGAADQVSTAVMANATAKAKYISCDPTAAGTAGTTCLQNTIMTFGRKMFRRPVTSAEMTTFMRFNSLTQTHTGNDTAQSILYAFLASPSFLSLPELGQTMDTATGAL